MKKYSAILAACLLCCLFIYVFYRTEKTVVNQLVMTLFSRQQYFLVKASIHSLLPLQDAVVYSLPEGLWVFSITLTSSFFYLELGKRKWSLVFLPMLLALVMELCQLLQWTNGRFDLRDINFAAFFWLLALCWTGIDPGKEPLFQSFHTKTICCVASYFIVFLARVTH